MRRNNGSNGSRRSKGSLISDIAEKCKAILTKYFCNLNYGRVDGASVWLATVIRMYFIRNGVPVIKPRYMQLCHMEILQALPDTEEGQRLFDKWYNRETGQIRASYWRVVNACTYRDRDCAAGGKDSDDRADRCVLRRFQPDQRRGVIEEKFSSNIYELTDRAIEILQEKFGRLDLLVQLLGGRVYLDREGNLLKPKKQASKKSQQASKPAKQEGKEVVEVAPVEVAPVESAPAMTQEEIAKGKEAFDLLMDTLAKEREEKAEVEEARKVIRRAVLEQDPEYREALQKIDAAKERVKISINPLALEPDECTNNQLSCGKPVENLPFFSTTDYRKEESTVGDLMGLDPLESFSANLRKITEKQSGDQGVVETCKVSFEDQGVQPSGVESFSNGVAASQKNRDNQQAKGGLGVSTVCKIGLNGAINEDQEANKPKLPLQDSDQDKTVEAIKQASGGFDNCEQLGLNLLFLSRKSRKERLECPPKEEKQQTGAKNGAARRGGGAGGAPGLPGLAVGVYDGKK